jgi:hypothetical protein
MKTIFTSLIVLLNKIINGTPSKNLPGLIPVKVRSLKVKSYFLLLVCFTFLSFTNLKAQCDFVNQGVKLNSSVSQVGGGCLINIDLSFDLSHNSGNKWVNIHIWPTASYPGLALGSPPNSTDLAAAVANIVIDQRSTPLSLSNTYKPDGTVPVLYVVKSK